MTVYYLDTTSGSDTANGLTYATAWKTYTKAGTVMVSGDSLLLYTSTPTGTTRAVLRARLGGVGFCNDVISSTALATSDATKIVDTTLTFANDAINYGWVRVTSGSASGDTRRISDWVASTGTLSPDRNFSAAIAAGNTYEIHRLWSPTQKDDALNQGIREAGRKWLRYAEDETLTVVIDDYDYRVDNLSTPIERAFGIDDVYHKSSTDTEWTRCDPNLWYFRDVAGMLYLMFDESGLPTVGNTLRLQYRVFPSALSSDASALNPDTVHFANYVCAKAAAMLFKSKARLGDEKQSGTWAQDAENMERKAELFYSLYAGLLPRERPDVARW